MKGVSTRDMFIFGRAFQGLVLTLGLLPTHPTHVTNIGKGAARDSCVCTAEVDEQISRFDSVVAIFKPIEVKPRTRE